MQFGRGKSPPKSQLASAGRASDEVRGSSTFTERFGTDVSQSGVADALALVSAWFVWREAAHAWLAYTQDQFYRAWMHSRGVLDPMHAIYTGTASVNPHIAEMYPALGHFFAVRTAISQRAASTRKRNAKAKAAAAAASGATTHATPAASATPTATAPVTTAGSAPAKSSG